MSGTLLLSVFALILLSARRSSGESAALGDSVNLTASKNCSNAEMFRLIRRLQSDTPLPVAERGNGVWRPAESYGERIESRSALRVLLRGVNINDGGWYEFTCGGRLVSSVELKVFDRPEVSASVGETVTLRCHCFTLDRSLGSVGWERNGEPVLELDPSSGEIRYGAGFRDRASLPSDWRSVGDLSLTLRSDRPEDRGDYSCFVRYKDARRPRQIAAVVRVSERKPDQTTCPPPPVPPTQNCATDKGAGYFLAVISGVAATVGIGALFCFGWGRWVKSRGSNTSRGSSCGGSATDVEKALLPGGKDGEEFRQSHQPLHPERTDTNCVTV